MAISIVQNLPAVTEAFADNLLIVATDNPNVQLIKHELKIGANVVSTQYSTVYQGQAELHLGPVYRSMLNYYNNPLNNDGTIFYVVDTNNHNLLINDVLTEIVDPVTKDFGSQNQYIRRIIKSVNRAYVDSMNPAAFCNLVDEDSFINRWVFENQKIPLMIRTHVEEDYTIQIKSIDTEIITNFGTVVTNQRMGQGMKRLSGTDSGFILSIIDGGNASMRLFVDQKCYPRTKTIYWLNSYGGWDWFNAIDYEIINKSDKLQGIKYTTRGRNKEIFQMSSGNITEYKLFGRLLNSEYYAYLKDMVSSPIVFDEEGERIRILDTNVDVVREDILLEPEIRIEYIKENSLIY